MTNQPVRLVAFANGVYSQAARLEKSIPNTRALAQLLEQKHQYESFVFADVNPNELQLAIRRHLAENALTGGTLILSWTGHGRPGKNGSLRLLGNFESEDIEIATAAELGEWAARTGALQILVVIDTCSAGAGLIDAAQLADSVIEQSVSRGSAWFGVVAASLADEPALSGALSREFRRILTSGPRHPDLRWDRKREFIRGDDLIQALRDDWSEPRQTPQILTKSSRAWDLVRNPLFEPGIPDQVVEHLLQAARGNSGEENFFTGREDSLSRIVTWMAGGKPGLFVVTGLPGSGKSAVVGRIVSLSSSAERSRILRGSAVPASVDPGQGSVDAHLQARGATVESAAEELLVMLGLDRAEGRFGLLSAAEQRRKSGDPLVIAIDGLDEAGSFRGELATEILKPLAQECLLLVSTRDVVVNGQDSLVALLGTPSGYLDLTQECEGTQRDIHEYVVRRLRGLSPAMDPVRVADEIVKDGKTSFLLARLVTSQLIDVPVDTSVAGWEMTLSVTVESALERDLQSVVLEIDGQQHPTAAREMLRALTMAYGSGFPADDVWPEVATAISVTSTKFTRDHAYKILAALGRHLIAGSEGDQPVYRIAHQRLVEYLSADTPGSANPSGQIPRRAATAAAVFELYTELLDAGFRPDQHRYLWRYAWRHLAEGGEDGLKLLHRLVDRDRVAFLPDLASGLDLASSEAFLAGFADQAGVYLEEAIDIWRELQVTSRLCMALFQLAMVRLAGGDQDGAERAAEEASQVAQELPESSNRGEMLATALVGRALTQISEARFHGAKLLADQALALANAQDGDSKAWKVRALASVAAGKAAVGFGDVDAAFGFCQQAVDLVDRYGDSESDELIIDPLSTLTAVHFLRAFNQSPRDESGRLLPASCEAGARLVELHGKGSTGNKILDIEIARGLQFVVRARLLDGGREVDVSHLEVPELDGIPRLLDRTIDETAAYATHLRDAALVLGLGLQLRSALRASTGNDLAERDRSEAVTVLRPFAEKNPLIAGTLGEILDSFTAQDMGRLTNQPSMADDMVSRQQEAISLLGKGGPSMAPRLPTAFAHLAFIYQIAGRTELQKAATSEAVTAARTIADQTPDGRLLLAALLSDQSALNLDSPLIASQYAEEALQSIRSLPDSAKVSSIAAFCELNLAGCRLCLREFEGTADLLYDAIKRLETPAVASASPVSAQGLALAYVNLANTQIAAGQFPMALENARRGIQLLDEPRSFSVFPPGARPMARIAEGLALQGVGEKDRGVSILGEAISRVLADVRAGTTAPSVLAALLNSSGSDMWDETMVRLGDRADLLRAIEIHRVRSRKEIHLTVSTLLRALASADSSELISIRAVARSHRAIDPAGFDAAWRDATNDLPVWLQLDMELIAPAVLWYWCDSLTVARNHLEAHPELLGPAVVDVLEEIRFSTQDDSSVDQLLGILAKARDVGAAAAYAPLMATEAVKQWFDSEDWIEHLNEHPDLLSSDVANFLVEQADQGDVECGVLSALFELAKRNELEVASKIAADPAASFELLRAAWRSKDVTRLAALAAIVRRCASDPHVSRKSIAVLTVARVLEGREDSAATLFGEATQEATDEERAEIVPILSDAMSYHPSHAGSLANLIVMLSTKKAGSG